MIDGNELSIVPDSLLEIGQYEIRIPSYAVTNSVGEPNGDILYQFSVTSTGKEEYAYLDSYFRLMDNGNLYVWHKDFPNLNTSDESIGEHLVLEDVKSSCLPRITCFTGPGIIRPSNIIILMMEIHFGGGDGWIHRKTLLEMERRKMFRNRL